ncbi:MAG: hypothetical protein CL477_14990 [Acidobacteria bacterium]|jgi:hypothetical protein|nr:hypothetical protein [Acidobacteriota bacterium]MDP7338969.1 hypothetical protein [Vicinamibacterales bacterium]MDP7478804.1 hypothetical protein [Vicinamibacterales bacterium]HJN42956.1 hypothetical protein [Vicinamibacterales bacterium]
MAEFNIQSSSVDVTRIMEQIRQRIREKRGTDYTEQQTQELATVKLERFLDPRQVRSDLVEHYRNLEPPAALEPVRHEKPGPAPEPFEFDEHTIYASSRGTMGKLIRLIRKLLNPILKLFINPNPVSFALTRQAEINTWTLRLLQQQTDLAERVTKQFERAGAKFAAREELDALNYEVLNNLVVEMSRLSVDMKNHRMLVESVAGRLDFDERRARALESVVQSRSPRPPGGPDGTGEDAENTSSTGTSRPRRRRRRSRRRSGGTTTPDTGTNAAAAAGGSAESERATSAPEPATTTLPTDTAGQNTEPAQTPAATPPPAPLEEPSAKPPETSPSTSTATSVDAALPTPAADTGSTAPSGDPEPPTPAALPQVADTGSPRSALAPPTPGPSDAPAPAAAPATETVAQPSPEGETGTDEQ